MKKCLIFIRLQSSEHLSVFTLHVILSHALEATSSITERLLSVILSASEESVTDPSLHFVPFRMTV